MNRCLIVLPARLASTRLPEKLLQMVRQKSILQHTYEAAQKSKLADGIIVALDHPRLAADVERFGGNWVMTSSNCQSGTDRVAEVAAQRSDIDVFINIQADEPEISTEVIDRVIESLLLCPDADMATAGTAIRDEVTLMDPACVKIVMSGMSENGSFSATTNRQDHSDSEQSHIGEQETEKDPNPEGQGRAVYFSRAAVPHIRDGRTSSDFDRKPPIFWHHIGIYAYRREFLQWFSTAPPSVLEQTEKLEQLRAIESGKKIVVAPVAQAASGIDTQTDLDRFRARNC